ncbi:glycosyltransferase family 10 domain-containing protein [Arcticibacter tournemirensis]
MGKIKDLYRLFVEYQQDKKKCQGLNIKVFNFCQLENPRDLWFYKYIEKHFGSNLTKENEVAVFSLYSFRSKLRLNHSKTKIWFASENINFYPQYSDHCLNQVDLSLAFEYIDHEKYLRFPLWFLYFIDPEYNYTAVKAAVYRMSHFNYKEQNDERKFCSLVCNHDVHGNRTQIFDALKEIATIDSGGAFLNNTPDLKIKYRDNKREFISKYKFNICPENSNSKGYVTEKVFEAIYSGCIPVYWGSNNNPEPDVLNKDAILFYSGPESLPDLKKKVLELWENKKLYNDFISQEKFLPHATEYVWDTLSDFHHRLEKLVKQSAYRSII